MDVFTGTSLSSTFSWQSALPVVVLAVVLVALRNRTATLRKYPFPPGPKGVAFVGNLFDILKKKAWEGFHELSRTYGDIVFLDVPLQRILVIGSFKTATDLLEKRSQIYSDRTVPVMIDLLNWSWNLAWKGYGQDWRDHRRTFNEHFRQATVKEYVPRQQAETRAFLQRIVLSSTSTDADLQQNLRHIFSAAILKIVYGIEINNIYDKYVGTVEKAVKGLSLSTIPGAFWIEYLPWLKFIPGWVPGAQFKKFVDFYRPFVDQSRNEPFELVRKAMYEGTASPSVALKLLQEAEKGSKANSEHELEVARNVTGLAYAAAADTTTSATSFFLAAILKYPDIQKKAQAQLDALLGQSRLPELSDLEDLPYVQALVLETLRWMPVAPLSVAHTSFSDDIYRGYYIPKGTIVFPNVWAMLHDPDDYPDPETFCPERFLNEDGTINVNVRDPETIAFGFGRRICPGRYFAMNSLNLFIASTLYAFSIEVTRNEKGDPINFTPEMEDGLISFPKELPCILTPRSEAIKELIINEVIV